MSVELGPSLCPVATLQMKSNTDGMVTEKGNQVLGE